RHHTSPDHILNQELHDAGDRAMRVDGMPIASLDCGDAFWQYAYLSLEPPVRLAVGLPTLVFNLAAPTEWRARSYLPSQPPQSRRKSTLLQQSARLYRESLAVQVLFSVAEILDHDATSAHLVNAR